MHCREICIKHEAKNLSPKEVGRYESGQKRCTSCEVYIYWDGEHCPCCGHFLRTKPRNARGRNILAQKIGFLHPIQIILFIKELIHRKVKLQCIFTINKLKNNSLIKKLIFSKFTLNLLNLG